MMTVKYLCSLLCLFVLVGCNEVPSEMKLPTPVSEKKPILVPVKFNLPTGESFFDRAIDINWFQEDYDSPILNNPEKSVFYVIRVSGQEPRYAHVDELEWRSDGSIQFVDCETQVELIMSSGTPFTVEKHTARIDEYYIQVDEQLRAGDGEVGAAR